MSKSLLIGIPGLEASEWGSYFCLEEELDDIILVSVHLIHNAGILRRERFSKAPALGHLLLSCGEKAFAVCRLSAPPLQGWYAEPAARSRRADWVNWNGFETRKCHIISENRKLRTILEGVTAMDKECLTSTKILVSGWVIPFILRVPQSA